MSPSMFVCVFVHFLSIFLILCVFLTSLCPPKPTPPQPTHQDIIPTKNRDTRIHTGERKERTEQKERDGEREVEIERNREK